MLINKPFEEGGPVIVSIDDNSFEIWFFDWHVVFFYVWTSFEGGVSREELREAIITAGSEESMKARYPGPSPEE
ncbi:MAG: hypothetical protein GY797_09500 [Deltaproteobacteria bacterium]|nr:hypothetical protein [Deltaproteobacteria bacterium]